MVYLSDSLKCSDLQGEETPRNKEMKTEIGEEEFKFTWKREKKKIKVKCNERSRLLYLSAQKRRPLYHDRTLNYRFLVSFSIS